MNTTLKTGVGLLIASAILILSGVLLVMSAFDTASTGGVDCDKGLWIDFMVDPPECESENDFGLSACCGGIVLFLVGVGLLIGAATTVLTGAVSGEKVIIIQQPSSGVKSLDQEIEELDLE